jgi:DTW domain-containing protein YfiP
MTLHPNTKRLICPQCLRPQRTCICRWIVPTVSAVEVLILQHPMEVDNAKGSARLLHLCLPNSRLVAGEVFAEQQLEELLFSQRNYQHAPSLHSMRPVLLYPSTPVDHIPHAKGQPAVRDADDVALSHDLTEMRLVVLDATWRKSRKMLHLNPLLQALPRLSLRDTPASQYRIRKAHAADQLSTFEATCYALMQLEGSEGKFQALLQAFNGFVDQQSEYRDSGAGT